MNKLTTREIDLLCTYYLGIDHYGYLNGFRDGQRMRAFFQVYCDLDINPTSSYGSDVSIEFVTILMAQTPQVQAKILRTVLEQFPPLPYEEPDTRNNLLYKKMLGIIKRLESETTIVENVSPKSSSEVVQVALKDAHHLIGRGSALSAVDRTHTALHGYLKDLCNEASIQFGNDPSMPELYKLVREKYPAFQNSGPRQQDIDNICRTLGNIVDKLGPIRNRATPAHPQEELLEEPEAILAINAARTLFHYLEEKRSTHSRSFLQRIFTRK